MQFSRINFFSLAFFITCLYASQSGAEAPNGEDLYKEKCASCHNLGVLAPTVDQLSKLTVEQIEAVMWHGAMQEHANGLSRPQRLAIARWLGNDKQQATVRPPKVVMCDAPMADRAEQLQNEISWPGWSPDNRFSRHVVDPGLTAARTAKTEFSWAHPFPSYAAFSSSGNPVAVHQGVVYTGNLNHWIYALDTERGCAYWTFRAEGRIRSNVAIEGNTLVFADLLANAYGLDLASGTLRWRTKVDFTPGARVTGNVTFHKGVVYVPVSSLEEVAAMKMDLPCCTFRGSIVALNGNDGSLRWKTYTIDRYAEYLGTNALGIDRFGPSGVPVWSGISVDDKRNLIYVGNGNQFTEPEVVESDAVMALDIDTGKKRWVKNLAPAQMDGKDIYHLACEAWWDPERRNCSPENPEGHGDRDIGAPPALITRADGKDVILVGSKDGMLYLLDADSEGRVIWNVRVGVGGEVGGIEYGVASDGRYAFAPVVDMNADLSSNGSLTAVDLMTGEVAWRVEQVDSVCEGKPTPPCGNAMITPPTVAGEVVFVGLIDGTLRAYRTIDGKEVWRFDTAKSFSGVNNMEGQGGSLGNGGPVVINDRVFITSGFSILNVGMPGNVLLSFKIPR